MGTGWANHQPPTRYGPATPARAPSSTGRRPMRTEWA